MRSLVFMYARALVEQKSTVPQPHVCHLPKYRGFAGHPHQLKWLWISLGHPHLFYIMKHLFLYFVGQRYQAFYYKK